MKKNESVIIRRGNSQDITQVYKLIVQLAVYEKAPDAVTATIADYIRNHEDNIFSLIVAELEGAIVGTCLYYDSFSTWKGRMLHLEDFIVDEHHRRKGIGTALFDAFIKEAKDRHCRLVKWQVLDWNLPAQRFYAKYKATVQKDWWNGLIYFD